MVFLQLHDGTYVQVMDVTFEVAYEAHRRGLPVGGYEQREILWFSRARGFHAWCEAWGHDPEEVKIV